MQLRFTCNGSGMETAKSSEALPPIRRLRDELGLTQKELGERIGVTRDRIAQLEGGKGHLSTRKIRYVLVTFAPALERLKMDAVDFLA